MMPTGPCRATLTSLALALGLVGCGSDSASPTAPSTTPHYVLVAETAITSFEVIKDGDLIEGAGEFDFTVRVGSFSKSWERTLSDGESAPLNWIVTLHPPYSATITPEIGLEFVCTEWDDVLGTRVPDSDMDHRRVDTSEVTRPGARISNYITMGDDACKVRLHYTIAADTVLVN